MTTVPQPELLDQEFLAHQHARLVEERRAAAEVVEALEAEVTNHLARRESGGTATEGFGTGETASVELEQVRDRHERAVARLAEIDAAFARLEHGTYGRCERCAGPIGRDRLEAIPTATRCILCQSSSARR